MGITSQQRQINDRRIISQGIQYWAVELGISLRTLARRTGHSIEYIKKVIAGEPVEIELDFLRDCVLALGRSSGRREYFEETGVENLSWEECVRLIRAPLPRQGKLLD